MRIVIDATPLLVRSAGVKSYLYNWILALRRHGPGLRLGLFPRLGELPPLRHDRSVLPRLSTWSRFALLGLARLGGAWATGGIAGDAEIFHASNLVRHAPSRARLTVTLHDLTTRLMPELHPRSNVRADRTFLEGMLRRADRILAISHHTRDDAVRLLGVEPDRIDVIYPGVSEAFFHTTVAEAAPVRARYRLNRPYALFVGTIEPRKNIGRLLAAWAELPGSLREEFDLVIAGPPGWQCAPVLARLKAAAGVRYLGYVPEADLPGLTAGATLFVYPSLYEGFGLPVAQALACCVPVIAAGVSSLPEVVGDAGVLVDPRSTGDIRAAIESLLLRPSRREELARRARLQASLFRWERAAADSVAFFERAAG